MLPTLALGGLMLIAGAVRMSSALSATGLAVMLWSGWTAALIETW